MKRDDNFSFKGPVAHVIGVPKAVILKEIKYWVEHNERKNANLKDGHHWMYNTASAFADHFYFLKEKSIERWLKELERDQIIYRKKYNQNRGDHTYWYRHDQTFYEACLTGQIISLSDWTNPQNEECKGNPQNEECRTSENEESNPQNEECRTSENEESYTTSPSTLQLDPPRTIVEKNLDDGSPAQDLFGQPLSDQKKKVPAKKKSHIRPDEADECITYLNEMTGRNYAHGETMKGSEANRKLLYSIFRQGYTLEDVKNMIIFKCHEWLKDKRNKRYLRPSTLFGQKNAPGYLDEAIQAVSDPEFAEMFKTSTKESTSSGGYTPDQESIDELEILKRSFAS